MITRIKLVCGAAAIGLFAQPVAAENWVVASENEEAVTLVDLDSVTTDGNLKKFKTMTGFGYPVFREQDDAYSLASEMRFNCSSKSYGIGAGQYFDMDGEPLDSVPGDPDEEMFQINKKDASQQGRFEVVCGGKTGTATSDPKQYIVEYLDKR